VEKVFKPSRKELIETGLPQKIVSNFISFREIFNYDSYFIRLKENGIIVLFGEEESYPNLLKEIDSTPSVLYVKLLDNTDFKKVFSKKTITVVGGQKWLLTEKALLENN
jgi:predicted Rossmann fold nucleotide-binding protein DprA/Smf involved in DNA uptake